MKFCLPVNALIRFYTFSLSKLCKFTKSMVPILDQLSTDVLHFKSDFGYAHRTPFGNQSAKMMCAVDTTLCMYDHCLR